MMYVVTLVSKDDNVFEYTVDAIDEDRARIKSKLKIEELGWEHYDYEVIDIKHKANNEED